MSTPGGDPGTRFTDVLTTASTVANYLGASEVSAGHLLHAIALLNGEVRMEDLGRGVSPLLQRASQRQIGASDAVRELAQRWYASLGSDVYAELSDEQLGGLRAELMALVQADRGPLPSES